VTECLKTEKLYTTVHGMRVERSGGVSTTPPEGGANLKRFDRQCTAHCKFAWRNCFITGASLERFDHAWCGPLQGSRDAAAARYELAGSSCPPTHSHLPDAAEAAAALPAASAALPNASSALFIVSCEIFFRSVQSFLMAPKAMLYSVSPLRGLTHKTL